MTWTKAIIHRLAEKIKTGTKFFVNHGKDTNSHDGRESVGTILSSFVKDISGKLSNVIIGHFPNADKVVDTDICSMEADINTYNDIVDDINDVSGIALGNSNIEHPAFPGAYRLNAIQCFNKDTENKINLKKGAVYMEPLNRKPTFHEIKNAVKEINIFPWQLFSLDDLKNDNTFKKIFEENSKIQSENELLKKELEEVKSINEEAIRKSKTMDATNRLSELMAEGFTDKQKTFITKQFDPDKQEDLSDNGLNKFIEKEKINFSETAKLFNSDNNSIKTGDENKSTDDLSAEDEALKLIGV